MFDQAVTDGDLQGQTTTELVAGLHDETRTVGAGHRRMLATIAALEGRFAWRADDCRDMTQWVALNLGIGSHRARRMTEAAAKIESLPRIATALESGELSLDKVVELTRFATPESEAKLIAWAKKVAPSTICRRADAECAKDEEEAKQTHKERFLRWWRDEDRLFLEGMFPHDQGAFVIQAIAKLADRLPEFPAEERPAWSCEQDLVEARRADALFLMAQGDCGSRMARPEVVVHTKLDALGNLSNGELASGGTLHPDLVAMLSCDCRLRFVLNDEDGNALGIGQASPTVPEWLRQQVLYRDLFTCTFPSCDMRGFLQVHHTAHGAYGGPTDLGNLTTTCSFHHNLVHLHTWRNCVLKDGTTAWFKPNGERYLPGPAPP
ncbi:MAG: DUF222 domain-containing protein [Actinomycetota bacterium]